MKASVKSAATISACHSVFSRPSSWYQQCSCGSDSFMLARMPLTSRIAVDRGPADAVRALAIERNNSGLGVARMLKMQTETAEWPH